MTTRQPLSDDEIFQLGFKAGFYVDNIMYDDDRTDDYGFVNNEGEVDNECFIKFVRLVEKAHGIGEGSEQENPAPYMTYPLSGIDVDPVTGDMSFVKRGE